jgi:hypothetical protein
VLAAVFVTGCNTLNYSQYQVKGPVSEVGARATLSAADRDAVKEIVSAIAAQYKLRDMTSSSLVPNTIAYFAQMDVDYPMEIKVYTAGDQVLVDVMQSNPGGETQVFRQLRETVLYELDQRFGARVYVTPVTKLMREKPRKAQ